MQDGVENQLMDLMAKARRAGADAVEVRAGRVEATSVAVRHGRLETVERQESERWDLKVWIGSRSAALSTADLGDFTSRADCVDQALAVARLAPEDPHALLPPSGLVRSTLSDRAETALDLYDPREAAAGDLEALAKEGEQASLAVEGVSGSDHAQASGRRTEQWHMTSEGFQGYRRISTIGLSVSAIAGAGGAMETDGYGRKAIWREDLPSPMAIGAEAGRRAVQRLGARKLTSTRAPVIFERRVAAQMLCPFLAAISGPSVARGTSFLKNRLGEAVFAAGVRVSDEPHLKRRFGSRLVDAEGVPTSPRALIDDGVLTAWLLDVASANQLGMPANGYAGGFANVTLAAGSASLGQLMAEAKDGLLVTGMFGPTLNAESGDWSAGVNGVWFEAGQVAYPVSEITVAGALPDFYARMVPGADLEVEGILDSPSLLVDGVAIGGL